MKEEREDSDKPGLTFSSEFEVAGWAAKQAGPWAKRRSFVDENYDRRFAWKDLGLPEKDGPKMTWLIEGLLPLKYLAVLGGDSKSGKTWFVTAMALSIALGVPFMGLSTQKRAVCWLSFEENPMERQIAFDAWFGSGGARPEEGQFFTSYERFFIDDPAGLQEIGEMASMSRAGLIVVDPLHASYSAGTLAEGSTARRVLSGVKQFTQDMDVTVLVIHHLTKQVGSGLVRERMADSGQILAAASMDWLMEVMEGKGSEVLGPRSETRADGKDGLNGKERLTSGTRHIRLMGRGRGEAVNRNWLIESPAPMVYRLLDAGSEGSKSFLEAKILEAVRDEALSSREIADSIRVGVGTVRNVLTRMVESGVLQFRKRNGKEREYWLPSFGAG